MFSYFSGLLFSYPRALTRSVVSVTGALSNIPEVNTNLELLCSFAPDFLAGSVMKDGVRPQAVFCSRV